MTVGWSYIGTLGIVLLFPGLFRHLLFWLPYYAYGSDHCDLLLLGGLRWILFSARADTLQFLRHIPLSLEFCSTVHSCIRPVLSVGVTTPSLRLSRVLVVAVGVGQNWSSGWPRGVSFFARIVAVCLAAFTSSGFFLSFLAPYCLGGCLFLCCLRSSFPILSFLRTNPNPTEYGAVARWARRCPEVGAGERAFLSLTGCGDLFLWVWPSSSLDSIPFLVGEYCTRGPSGDPALRCSLCELH